MHRLIDQADKDEAVRMYLETDKSAATVAEIYGVTARTLMAWVRAYRDAVAMAGRRQA